jgi:CPW-WPC domain-containing protein
MYVYVLIGFLIVFLMSYTKNKSKENFENCYLNVGNTKKNGNKTFFTNMMVDSYFNRQEALNNVQTVDNNTIKSLQEYKKNIFSSNDQYNRLNNQYNTFNNDIDQQFNKINNDLNNKISEAKTQKDNAINKFNTIDSNMSKIVSNGNSTLDSKLKPIVTSTINNNLNQISDNSINNINTNSVFNNRMTNTASNINNWQNIPGFGSPMRIDPETGNVQCLSYDGRNCVWNNSDLSQIKHNDVKPLTCGSDHKRIYGSTGYDTTGHWCNTVNNYIAKNNIDQVDWSRCPAGWTNVDKEGNVCNAPSDYTGVCNKTSYFSGYSNQNKQGWATFCTARWPFKTNTINAINNIENVSTTINDTINNKIGNLSSKTVLGQFSTYNNGVYVKAYKLGPNNSRGNIIQEGIITTNVNFDWGVGLIFGIRENTSQTNTDMIYLELTGYIKIPVNVSNIKFRLKSDDGSRLIFSTNKISEMKMIIDMWNPQGATSKESENISVQPNKYVPFQIQFFEQYGAAGLKLEWSINSGAFTIIPREVFYINNEICTYKFNFNYIQEIDTRAKNIN